MGKFLSRDDVPKRRVAAKLRREVNTVLNEINQDSEGILQMPANASWHATFDLPVTMASEEKSLAKIRRILVQSIKRSEDVDPREFTITIQADHVTNGSEGVTVESWSVWLARKKTKADATT